MKQAMLVAMVMLGSFVELAAQAHSPVWDSYLDRIEVWNGDRQTKNIDFVWRKNGGTGKHVEHQVWLLGFRAENERKILELAEDEELRASTKPDWRIPEAELIEKRMTRFDDGGKRFLDVLLERKLVVVLGKQVGKQITKENDELDPKTAWAYSRFPFSFEFRDQALFERIRKLEGFPAKLKGEDCFGRRALHSDADFKIMPFIPVNDCKYADLISIPAAERGDFTFELYSSSGPIIQYLRPLPQVFRPRPVSASDVIIDIH